MKSKILDINKIRNSQMFYNPFEHKIIDNFFPDEVYKKIRTLGIEMSKQVITPNKTYPMWMNEVLSRGGDQEAVQCVIDSSNDILENINYLMEDFTDTQKSSQGYFAMPKFGISGNKFKYPIHLESSHKVILFVVYIFPEEDTGTQLFKTQEESSFVKAIEWKENRAFMMTTKVNSRNTWHNWEGRFDHPRVTLNIFCEKLEELENSVIRSGKNDSVDDLIWLYDQFSRGNLTSNK